MSIVKRLQQLDEDPDYQFFNCNIVQNSTYGNQASPALLTISRGAPIVNHIENFYVTVGRLSFPSNQLPLLTAPLIVGSNYSTGQTIYSFTLTYKNFSSGKTNIIWQPTNMNFSPGTGTVQVCLQSQNPYYYCYTFWRFCQMMNTALTTAFNALSVASGGTLPVGAAAPYFYWSSESQTTILVVQIANYDQTVAFPIQIYFNNELQPIMNGFYFDRIAENSPSGQDNRFQILQNYDSTNPLDLTHYYIRPSVFDSSYWSSVQTLELLSTIPVNYESVQPINYNYGQVSTNVH
jgi:hypothetical protein